MSVSEGFSLVDCIPCLILYRFTIVVLLYFQDVS